MSSFNVVVKHKGTKYDVTVDRSSTGEDFKFQLFSLTGVEPERQKIIVKGGQLRDETEMGSLGLMPGQQMMMMGTPGESGRAIVRPSENARFVEDMTEAERAQQQGATPAGLINLGNTCYLNSTLQTLRSIPELQTQLTTYQFRQPARTEIALDLTDQLKALYRGMGQTQRSVPPYGFLLSLRTTFPQFAERSRDEEGGYAQQDAEEAWSQIVSSLKQKLQLPSNDHGPSKTVSWVDRYMAGEFTSVLECDDPEARMKGEQPTHSRDTFLKLNCHIDKDINHLRDGILKGLKEPIEKRSELLGRDVLYTKKSKISRLPKYLTVHFVRFFWKRDVQKKAKIMRKVTFPQELDVVEFCDDKLRNALVPVRDKVREVRKEEEDMERARKRRKREPETDANTAGSLGASDGDKKQPEKKTATSADGDIDTETYKTDAEIDAEQDASLLASKKALHALIDPKLLKDDGTNQSGLYELRGVVTHQGASADSGHYTAYVKKTGDVDAKTGKTGDEDGKWWWFNDDKVTEVTSDRIDALAGGGESHSALILLYQAIPLPTAEGLMK